MSKISTSTVDQLLRRLDHYHRQRLSNFPLSLKHRQAESAIKALEHELSRRRKRNPRGGKFDRCVADVSRSRSALNPYAVCASRLKPKRRRRNRVVRRVRRRKRNVTRRGSRGQLFSLLARKANQPPMVYTGDKFARHGKPVLFQNLKTAKAVASFMHRQYPVLRGYSIWARAV